MELMARRSPALSLALVLACALLGSACEQDTCSKGLTMPSPSLGELLESEPNTTTMKLRWAAPSETAASLPQHYFDPVLPRCVPLKDTENGALWDAAREQCPMGSAKLSGERELTLNARTDQLQALRGQSFRVWLELPDRRDFVDCKHPRPGDSYVIDLRISVDEQGMIGPVEIRETHRLTMF